MAPAGGRHRSAAFRAATAGVLLAVVWGLAFWLTSLAFFGLIAAGGVLTGAAGLWVRRALVDHHDGRSRPPPPIPLPAIRLRPAEAVTATLAGLAHLAVAYALVGIGRSVVPGLVPNAEEVYGLTNPSLWLSLLLAGVVIAPLEEIYWRGAAYPLLADALRRTAPRLSHLPGALPALGAVAYAAFHLVTGEPALVAAALLGGVVWSWLAERTGTVGAPMLAHTVWALGMVAVPPV